MIEVEEYEYRFYKWLISSITVFLIIVTICVTCKSAYKDYLKVKALANGVDPIYIGQMFRQQ
jgi:hypothetical protein